MDGLEKNGFIKKLFPKPKMNFDQAKNFGLKNQKDDVKSLSKDLEKPNFLKRHNPFSKEMRDLNKGKYKDLRDYQSNVHESIKAYRKNMGAFTRMKDPVYSNLKQQKKHLDKEFGKSYMTKSERFGQGLKNTGKFGLPAFGTSQVTSELRDPKKNNEDIMKSLNKKYN